MNVVPHSGNHLSFSALKPEGAEPVQPPQAAERTGPKPSVKFFGHRRQAATGLIAGLLAPQLAAAQAPTTPANPYLNKDPDKYIVKFALLIFTGITLLMVGLCVCQRRQNAKREEAELQLADRQGPGYDGQVEVLHQDVELGQVRNFGMTPWMAK
jgi:hypothetical protein